MIKLKVLLMCGKSSVLDNNDLMEFNLKNVLIKGKGILSEIVARHIVLNKYPAKLLNVIEEEQEDEEFQSLEEQADRQEELKLLKEPDYKEFYGIFMTIFFSSLYLFAWNFFDHFQRYFTRNTKLLAKVA